MGIEIGKTCVSTLRDYIVAIFSYVFLSNTAVAKVCS